jgi:UDP-N-acetylglucosamine 2-epimerase
MVLGIRPDIIRASLIINSLREKLGTNFKLIWSGQHYSDNLKDVFFKELGVDDPDIELEISGNSDAELVASMITKLSLALSEIKPEAVIFLGDTNTVTGTIAVGQLNIPVVHIEGCMRSYDWRMPEEKYRTVADHLSDLIYCYLDGYKDQGLAEGIPASNIIVTGNPIVDVLQHYYINSPLKAQPRDVIQLLEDKYSILSDKYYVMTCHRRENVESKSSLERILSLAGELPYKVAFPAGYRTQEMINNFNLTIPSNVSMVDPIGYKELLDLVVNSKGVLTDSGTVVEETAILGVPTIQMRTSTERPEVYEFGSAVRFDPHSDSEISEVIAKFNSIKSGSWVHTFGDGKASTRIVEDLVNRYESGSFTGHQKEKYFPYSRRSFSLN